ncbi:thaumatin family protein [Actinoplanes sp. NPDC049265]|uniref:thaumatin family protein n=1 Tax=Actinoplanes sp. NPDC049265 TaxID=3363902 RepID=UPI00371E0A2E
MPGKSVKAVLRPMLTAVAVLVLIAGAMIAGFGDAFTGDSEAHAATNHTVTFVNDSGEKIWVGSTVNADGSQNFGSLPILEPGQRATITIPETSGPGHWRGKFFARQRCGGDPGTTFHCAVGDCGNAADHCAANSEQPTSLAEFNFDPADALSAAWYNISYVNAVSLPVTITPTGGGAAPQEGSQHCGVAGCAKPFVQSCPEANLIRDDRGAPLNCVNPNRDAETDYSRAITGLCPKAYSWSKQDTKAGNQTMFECKECSGFTVTFHGNGTPPPAAEAPAQKEVVQQQANTPKQRVEGKVVAEEATVPGQLRARKANPAPVQGSTIVSDWQGKCLDVPGANFADGVHLQVWGCDNTDAQRWAIVDGMLRTKDNLCVDVAWGSRDNGAVVQLAQCTGNAAQQWVLSDAGDLVNPQADKCLDIKDWNAENGAPVQLWDCAGTANQKWHRA